MELDELEQSVARLNAAIDVFPIGAITLSDVQPVERKIWTIRESLTRLRARLLMLRAKAKLYNDVGRARNKEVRKDELQSAISDTITSAKAVELCLHSATIQSALDGDVTAEDQRELDAYMNQLFILNDEVIKVQESIEEAIGVQLDLKMECQQALSDYKDFLKEQEEIRSKKLQETNPEIVINKSKVEKTVRRINVMKKLIGAFIATSSHKLVEEPVLEQILEKHRELMSNETVMKLSQNNE